MSKKFKLIWLDDYWGRKRDAKALATALGFTYEFIYFDKKDPDHTLKIVSAKLKSSTLLVIDHVLDMAASNVITRGSTVAEIFRESFPKLPIVGITAADKQRFIDYHQQSIYDDLFIVGSLTESYETIASIAEGYKSLRSNRPRNTNGLVKRLQAPKEDIGRLKAIIPTDLKNEDQYRDASLLFRIAKWIRHTLFAKPGFLFDELWLSTLMGLKESSLPKVEKIMEDAKYVGIFVDSSRPRWWVSRAKEILHEHVRSSEPIPSWYLGRQLQSISKADYSQCYVCQGKYPEPPEIVGFTDTTGRFRKPMHLRCSRPHPMYEKSLFFEEMRVMKDRK